MDYWEWVENFKPIINHLDNKAPVDGYLFTNYGSQWDFVKRYRNDKLWSLIITDTDSGKTHWEIANGIHVVNREGFLITRKKWLTDTFVTY